MLSCVPIPRLYLHVLVMVVICRSFLAERRIKGRLVPADDPKRYAVYLLKNNDKVRYTGWTCGGAIVCRSCVLTSAACIEDVKYVYVIAGYNKYVAAENIESDKCTKQMKKKVIYTCVPLNYTLDYNMTSVWSHIDIAVIQVESNFDFNDDRYEKFCSYKPQIVRISYQLTPRNSGNDAFVLGWGHKYKWRNDKDRVDLNQPELKFAATRIMDHKECKEHYKSDKEMQRIVDKYMICTLEEGNLNTKGEVMVQAESVIDGCDYDEKGLRVGRGCQPVQYGSGEILDNRRNLENDQHSDEEAGKIDYLDETRTKNYKVVLDEKQPNQQPNVVRAGTTAIKVPVTAKTIPTSIKYDPVTRQNEPEANVPMTGRRKVDNYNDNDESDSDGEELLETISNEAGEKPGVKSPTGFCQNDHGGPLVTWEGKHEVVIGVASVFKLDRNNHCRGPYLFTSTQCNSAFLNCIINELDGKDKSRRCLDSSPDGFQIAERRLSWIGHPDGPADNEKILTRAQVPMSAFHL